MCFKEGGGLAGCREEYSSDRSHMHAMFTECLEGVISTSDTALDALHSPDPPYSSASPPPAIDDQIIVPISAMCIPSSATNPDIIQDLYISCDSEFPTLALSGLVDFENSSFLLLTNLFNALLDSGCTHHIIKDRSLFLNYMPKDISVGTANCVSLQALGTGDVAFCSPYGDCCILSTLCGCLHAPTSPINLLSIGALVECGMSAIFTPGSLTKVSFPSDHPNVPGFSFSATVHNWLSFLKLEFVLPMLVSLLWHSQL